MRVLFVCDEYPPRPHGGIGTFVQTMSRAMIAAGHHAAVIGIAPAGSEEIDQGVQVTMIPRSGTLPGCGLLDRMRLLGMIRDLCRNGEFDVVETPDCTGLVPFRVGLSPLAVRLHLTITVMAAASGEVADPRVRWLERRALTGSDGWIAVSQHVLRQTSAVFGLVPRRSAVVYNPAPETVAAAPSSLDLPGKFVLYLGTFSERKGAFVLAAAAREFLRSSPALHLVFIGLPYQESLQEARSRIEAVVGTELVPRVHVLGWMQRDLAISALRRAVLLCSPSQLEAGPMNLLEAMKEGVPVVFSRFPPGPEIVDDEQTGLLVDPTDPHDVARAVERLVGDRPLRERLIKNALRTVQERFSVGRCLEDSLAFWESLRREAGSRRRGRRGGGP